MCRWLITIVFALMPAISCYADETVISGNLKERWYSDQQVEEGNQVYKTHCQICHLANAEGTKQWKKMGSNGFLPPPPLNGSAHTWHHSTDVLIDVINKGGQKYGGQMPGFESVLSEQEKLSVIAYVQSYWPEAIYEKWLKIEGN